MNGNTENSQDKYYFVAVFIRLCNLGNLSVLELAPTNDNHWTMSFLWESISSFKFSRSHETSSTIPIFMKNFCSIPWLRTLLSFSFSFAADVQR